jgi:aminoglycoside phosphotransferase (APT) family kinase protein
VLIADDVDVTPALEWAASVSGPVAGVQELEGGWTSTMLALTKDADDDLVLRLMTREPWRTHGAGLTTRESQIQTMLERTPVPAPRSRALDADGRRCGHPAHLMTRLPGTVELDRVDADVLDRLADVLMSIHEVVPTIEVPSWATDPRLWEEGFALLRTQAPEYEPRFIHRDFQPRNVLWSAGRVSGVVDWVEASIGPAWLDVAHCCTNLAIVHGNDVADRFAAAYVERSGRDAQPYFDVMDVIGFLPPPGKSGFFDEDGQENRRLEQRLRSVMVRVGR